MPEIVEVEKLRLQLSGWWSGSRLESVEFFNPTNKDEFSRYLLGVTPAQFREAIINRLIVNVTRHGKHLFVWVKQQRVITGPLGSAIEVTTFGDDPEKLLIWHIQLHSTGWFLPVCTPPPQLNVDPKHFLHTVGPSTLRGTLRFAPGDRWNYYDARTWGRWRVYTVEQQSVFLKTLGPDWVDQYVAAERALVVAIKSGTVKGVLTDQTITAGLGNYLSCEILYRAGIHPHMPWAKVTPKQRERIAAVTVGFLAACLKERGHGHWRVFDKKGQLCEHCDTPIKYRKDAGGARGSYYCGECQPEPEQDALVEEAVRT